MREVFKINMVDKVIIGIAILVILLIIFSNNTWMEKIISALAFLILYYIVLHYGKAVSYTHLTLPTKRIV